MFACEVRRTTSAPCRLAPHDPSASLLLLEDFAPVFSPDFCVVSASLLMCSFRIALSEFNFEWCLVGWLTESYSVCSPTNGVRIILS